jgi:chloramphenicol-sensitive protein RarD
MTVRARAVLCAVLCYLVWAVQPLYWVCMPQFDPMFIQSARVVMSCICTSLYLCFIGRGAQIAALIRDKKKMRFVVPAAVFIGMDWGFFIWAVNNGHLLDASLGYYLNPMIIFLMGLLMFHEKGRTCEYAAMALACCGFLVFTAMSGSFPLLALIFAVVFPLYALMKKFAGADPLVSIAVESLILSPFFILWTLLNLRGEGGLASVTWESLPLLLGSGVVTALPMILYTASVNHMPMKLIGIMQYFCTTISMIFSVTLLGEKMTLPKAIMAACIVAGIVVFTAGSFRKEDAQEGNG